MIRAAIVSQPIDILALIREIARDSCGATATFLGTVRSVNAGRPVTGIEYSAYDEMAVSEMTAILREAAASFDIDSAIIEHRVGALDIGDASIAVVISSAHRAPALDAVGFVVNETKARVPVWKREHYADGTREWVGAMTGQPG